jgi:tRNA-binding EMAP/Myf-like protein
VDIGRDAAKVRIVFGGHYKVEGGELVPVAPPGATTIRLTDDGMLRIKRMRSRRYRGERSHGMLCSFDELGWPEHGGLDEVAILRGVTPGQSLDNLSVSQRRGLIGSPRGWKRTAYTLDICSHFSRRDARELNPAVVGGR